MVIFQQRLLQPRLHDSSQKLFKSLSYAVGEARRLLSHRSFKLPPFALPLPRSSLKSLTPSSSCKAHTDPQCILNCWVILWGAAFYSSITFSCCISLDQRPGAPQRRKYKTYSIRCYSVRRSWLQQTIKSENSCADQRLSYLQILPLTVAICACLKKTVRTGQVCSSTPWCALQSPEVCCSDTPKPWAVSLYLTALNGFCFH